MEAALAVNELVILQIKGVKMTEIFNFPSRIVRVKSEMERAIRNELKKLGFPIEMENEIMQRMGSFLDSFCVEFDFTSGTDIPFSIEQQIIVKNKLHDYTNLILVDRINLEIEIYFLKHSG